MTLRTILASCVLLASTTIAFAQGVPEAIKIRGSLVVGTAATIGLPYSDIAPGTSNQHIGAEPELAAAIAEKLGLKIQMMNLGFDSLIPSLEANRIDMIMSGMLDTAAREQKVDFVNHIYGGSAMITRVGMHSGIKNLDDLCGLTVSAMRGSLQEKSITEQNAKCLARNAKGVDAQIFPDNGAQITALASGRIDVMTAGLPYLSALVFKNSDKFQMVGEAFNFGPTGIAIQKGSSLVPEVAKAVSELIEDGTYSKIMLKYGFNERSFAKTVMVNGGTAR